MTTLSEKRAASPAVVWAFDPFDRSSRAPAGALGGKGDSLVALVEEGCAVPRFVCLTTRAFDQLFARLDRGLREALAAPPRDRPAEVAALAARARRAVQAEGLSEEVEGALLAAFDGAFEPGESVSVRSSALGEDAESHSFAGQFDTYLCVGRERLGARVLDCLASAVSERALQYRALHGLGPETARMGVVVQRMVDAAAAGVAFTADPVSGRDDRVTISAAPGLGISVVDGSEPVDTFTVLDDGRIAARDIRAKAVAVVPAADGEGTVREPLASELEERPALSDEAATEIAARARDLAVRRGVPQDVEWALADDGAIYLLQARPVTTRREGTTSVFDNSNLVESYPGLTLPLTFSLMRRAYRDNFGGLVRAFGGSRRRLERNDAIFDNLVGLLAGRMYYNLSNWYLMFGQVPGMERALPAFEKAMGFEAQGVDRSAPSLRRRLRWLPLQLWVVAHLVFVWATLGRRVRGYRSAFEDSVAELDADRIETLDAHELQARVDRYSALLFGKMSAAPISDFFTQQLFGLLGALIGRWDLGDPVGLRNELLCGEQAMESVEPVRSLVGLAESVAAEPIARALFESEAGDEEVWARLHADARYADLADRLDEHVRRYGDRTLEELKLETRTLVDEPSGLVPIIRNYLRAGKSVAAMESHEREIREAAERRVAGALRGHPLRRLVFGFVLRRCRWGLKARESIRLTRGRMAGFFRRLYRALGKRLVAAGALVAADDVFYLSTDEVADLIRGASLSLDPGRLVALRREEYGEAAKLTVPSRIEATGVPVAADLARVPPAAGTATLLSGIGCSPGRVTGKAMVVREPHVGLRIDGEILVARTTDPGWVFLMVAAAGLVAEQGNMLSHTAIIGRELGVPTIVGVDRATERIGDGVMLELDGRAGTVVVGEAGDGD